jgi:probable HAF family extracellular repeat protein
MFGKKSTLGRATRLLGLVASLSLYLAAMCNAQSYTVEDLGYIGGVPKATNPEGVSSDGKVTGYSYVSGSSVYNAFLFNGGTMFDLGSLIPNSFSIGTSVNENGDVVGYGTLATGGTHAFLVSNGNGVMTDLGTLPGGANSIAYSINSAGTIVGYSSSPNSGQRAVIFANGTVTDLGALNDFGTPGAGISIAHAVNNKGQIAGWSFNFDTGSVSVNSFSTHAFLLSNGVMKDIGGITAMGLGLNDSGVVVGSSTFPDGEIHGVLFDGSGGYTDLGNLMCIIQDPITFLPGTAFGCFNGQGNSGANAINNFGQIVGNSDTQHQGLHAFLFLNGRLRDLNWYIPANSGWVLQTATAINDRGQIVGNGTHNGVRAGYLLTPICASDVTNSISVTRGGFSFSPVVHKFGQFITITNTGSVDIVGPIKIALDNLSSNATATATTGVTTCNAPLNSPYYQVNVTLAPGVSATTSFVFDDPTKMGIDYQTRVFAGSELP